MIIKKIKKFIRKSTYFNYFKGYTYYKMGKLEEAQHHIEVTLTNKLEYSLAIQLLMSIGIVKNNKEIVAQAFDLIAHKPKTSQLDYLTMVYGLVYLGQYSLAEQYLKKIYLRKYKNDVILIKADIAADKNQYKTALNILRKIGELERIKDPYVLVRIGRYMIELGDKDDALLYINKAQVEGDTIVIKFVNELLKKFYE